MASTENTTWAEAEREYHNAHAQRYVRDLERGHIFHLADDRLLFSHLPAGRDAMVILDAGCGPAISPRKFLLPRLRPDDRYLGLDIAERLLEVARANVPGGTFVQQDLQRLRLRPESLDAVLCLGALHHAPEPQPVLRELLRGLRPGGLLLLREPTDRAFKRGQGDSPAEQGLQVAALKSLLEDQGAAILSETYLTSWLFIHLRHRLQRLGLAGWERWRWPWRLKLAGELALDRRFGSRLPRRLRGLDLWMAVRKAGTGARSGAGTLDAVLACPSCGRELDRAGEAYSCTCGSRLVAVGGLWTFAA